MRTVRQNPSFIERSVPTYLPYDQDALRKTDVLATESATEEGRKLSLPPARENMARTPDFRNIHILDEERNIGHKR